MSILYKIFGVPQYLEEFADKVKRKGIKQVQVGEKFEIENEEVDFRSGRFLAADYVNYVAVRAEGINEFVCDNYRVKDFSNNNTPEVVKMIDNERRRNCLDVAKQLRDLGIEAKLSSYSLWDYGAATTHLIHSIEEAEELMKK